jgi:glycerol-3-phosphate dehydrogenase (NAD(P)+)
MTGEPLRGPADQGPISRTPGVRAAVIGAGSWGTALALLLHDRGHQVSLWSHDAEIPDQVRATRENPYLAGIRIPESLKVTRSLAEALDGAVLVVSVSPSQFVGSVMASARAFLGADVHVVSASKGIELTSLRRMDEVLGEALPDLGADRLSVLSGPSFALEVAQGIPTAVVVASTSKGERLQIQDWFSTPRFRVYTVPDVVGVELGGAVKNVIALAAGVAAGLGFGHNTQAALITRGLAEITRLGVAMGAQPETFSGLAGMGDLVLTCTGELSRNRTVGTRIGRGETLSAILGEMRAVAEGVQTAAGVLALAKRHGVEMPIVQEVNAILHEGRDPAQAVHALMVRGPKPERWG